MSDSKGTKTISPCAKCASYKPCCSRAKCWAVNHRDLWMVADWAAAWCLLGLWDNWKSSAAMNVIVLWHTLYGKLRGLNFIFIPARTRICMRWHKRSSVKSLEAINTSSVRKRSRAKAFKCCSDVSLYRPTAWQLRTTKRSQPNTPGLCYTTRGYHWLCLG